MADYVPAWIEIGGPIPRELVPELIDCIQSEGVSHSFGGGAIEARSADDLLDLAQDTEGHPGTLKLYDEQVHNGEFDYLESFLEEHAIPFSATATAALISVPSLFASGPVGRRRR